MKKARTLESFSSDCYRVKDEPRKIFLRIFSLYSLSNFWEDRESEKNSAAPQLTTVLLQNTGKIVFPVFRIIRQCKIFRNRQDLLNFETVCALESQVAEAFVNKNFTSAIEPIKTAKDQFTELFNDNQMNDHVTSMPEFLRKFTTGSVLAYILTKGVEVYERLKEYEKAVEILERLLSQKMYLPNYHGHWYERLVLDLDQHLKNPKRALETIKEGLNDPYVQEARLLFLSQRVIKIINTKKNNSIITYEDRKKFENHSRWLTPQQPFTETIQGEYVHMPIFKDDVI